MIQCIIENSFQYELLLKRQDVDVIIISRDCFLEKDIPIMVKNIKNNNKIAYVRLERLSRINENYKIDNRLIKDNDIYNYKNILDIDGLDGILVQNIDSFYGVFSIIKKSKNKYDNILIELDYDMNIYNIETKKFFIDYCSKICNNRISFTYPIELSIKNMLDLNMNTFVVYSRFPTMVSNNCIFKNNNKCQCNKVDFILDRKNKKLYYKSFCKYCYSKIYNTDIYYVNDLLQDTIFENFNYENIRYDFSICEKKEDIEKVFLNEKAESIFDSFTRGHIKKSIE